LIDRREVLIPALAALAEELPGGHARRETRQLITQLRAATSGADLRRSKEAVRWLPLLASGSTDEPNTPRLGALIAQASRESENYNQRRLLLAYPLTLLVIVLLVSAFLCTIVVPTFGGMFREFGLRVPLSTRIVMTVADQVLNNPIGVMIRGVLMLAAIVGLASLWTHFAMTTRVFGTFVAGNSASLMAMSSLTSQLAELLSINVALPDALWMAGQGCRHYYFKQVAEQLARDAYDGTDPLSDSPVAHRVPSNLIRALQPGSNGPPNIPLLRELSAIYGERARGRIDWFSGGMAQLAIVATGVIVAFIVLALFSPLVSLISGLT
jgi:type IV pilus assembly protein PilC